MPEYKVVWVYDFVSQSDGTQVISGATAVMNEHAADGWRVLSVQPGTNAQTYSGLFIAFVR